MFKLAIAFLLLLLALCLAVSVFQNRILFPTHLVGRAGSLPAGTQPLGIDTPDGYHLEGVHIPPSRENPAGRLLVVGFAGNAWNSADAADYLSEVYPEAHVVAFHYRGYSPSTGSPTAKALLEDAPLVLDAAVRRVKPDRTILAGFSIGSGVAASLAGSRKLDGIILVTPFDSLKAVAQGHYPWLPVGLFFREEMNAAESLSRSDVAVAIISAERDTLIPPARTDALRRRVRNLVLDRTVAKAGHNDIYQASAFHDAMCDALAALP